jgi:dipeptidyl aminopeptidase/acylaminoacyl peptidase
VHGERDLRVPLSQGIQYWSALRHHGVPVEMVVYPREGHSIREYAHQIDVMPRMLAWYRRWDRTGDAAQRR